MVGKMALLKPQTSNLRTFKTKTTPRMSIKHLACRRTSHEKRGTARRRCGPEAARRAVAAPHRAAPARVSGVPPVPHPITPQDGTHGEIHLPDARRELRPQSQLLAVRRGACAARRFVHRRGGRHKRGSGRRLVRPRSHLHQHLALVWSVASSLGHYY